LPDALRELNGVRLDPPDPLGALTTRHALVEEVPQDLLDEEGIARGLSGDRAAEVFGDLTAAQGFEHRVDLGVGMVAEDEACNRPLAPEPGQHVAERVAAPDLYVAVSA